MQLFGFGRVATLRLHDVGRLKFLQPKILKMVEGMNLLHGNVISPRAVVLGYQLHLSLIRLPIDVSRGESSAVLSYWILNQDLVASCHTGASHNTYPRAIMLSSENWSISPTAWMLNSSLLSLRTEQGRASHKA